MCVVLLLVLRGNYWIIFYICVCVCCEYLCTVGWIPLCFQFSEKEKKTEFFTASLTPKHQRQREREIKRGRGMPCIRVMMEERDGGRRGDKRKWEAWEEGWGRETNQPLQGEREARWTRWREGGGRIASEGWGDCRTELIEVLLQSCCCWKTGWEPRIMLHPSVHGGTPDTF